MARDLQHQINLVKQLMTMLSSTALFSSFPLSCFLIGLEALIDLEFSCPCRIEWNHDVSNLLIIAPACFAFVLMFLLIRPCGFKLKSWNCDKRCLCDTTTHTSVKGFLHCLIPPLIWFFLVLYDGDYYVCSRTDWNGTYVNDEVLGKKWCKPAGINDSRAELQLRNQAETLFARSKLAGCILLIVLCTVTFIIVCVYDCRVNFTCCGIEQQDDPGQEMSTTDEQSQPH